jgi:hypothetical protein
LKKCRSKSFYDPWCYSCRHFNIENSCELNLYRILKPGTYYVISDSFEKVDAGSVELTTTFEKAAGSGVDGDSCADALPLPNREYVHISTFKAKDDVKSFLPDTEPPINTAGAADVVRKFVIDEPSYFKIDCWAEEEFEAVFFLSPDCSKKSKKELVGLSCYSEDSGASINLEKGTYYLIIAGTDPNMIGQAGLIVQIETVAHFEKACKDAPQLKLGETVEGKTDGWDRFYSTEDDYTHDDAFYRLVIKEAAKVRVTMKTKMPGSTISIRNECAWRLIPTKEEDDRTAWQAYGKAEVEADLKPGTYWVVFNSGGGETKFTISVEALEDKKGKDAK